MAAHDKETTPLLVPLLAALPVSICMVILGLPELGGGYPVFRVLFFVACMGWIPPLALIQRALWRKNASWPAMALLLLAVSYVMSVLNALLAQRLAIGLGRATGYHWGHLVYGLDGCWLALVAFCAIHAVAVYYVDLQRTRLRLAQAQAAARDAELRALRYQLNPHFLFNTLNAISALVSAQRNGDANHMLARVSDFLRATLAHDGAHEHALADELALTEAYLDIEKARVGERLLVTMKAGPGLLAARVPYLLLQPLVENAIRHGIAPRRAAGRVDIRIERAGDLLRIAVCNDGAGGGAAGGEGAGIGLANVGARLRQLYGDAGQVDAGWRDGVRFEARLTLPLAFAAERPSVVAVDDAHALRPVA